MNIAWVSQSLPYLPSADGFAIQAGHLIPLLAQRHRIDLISLIRDGDEAHLDWASRYCASVQTIRMGRQRLSRRLANFVSGYLGGRHLIHRREMQSILRTGLASRQWDVLHVEGGFAAGLIPEDLPIPKVLAEHDSEVLKAEEILGGQTSLRTRLHYTVRRYHEPRYERLVFPRFDRIVMVAERDVAFNRKLFPEAKFSCIPMGVDCNHYQPAPVAKEPFALVFHGNLNYPPNLEAAFEFVDHVLPLLRVRQPNVNFHLVAANPPLEVQKWASRPDIRLSINLSDVRPAICSAIIYVSAVRRGSGISNKILEAMALRMPIVCYQGSAAGIDCVSGDHLLFAHDPEDFAAKVLNLLTNPELAERLACRGRELVQDKYGWEVRAAEFERLYEQLVDARCRTTGGGKSQRRLTWQPISLMKAHTAQPGGRRGKP